MTSQGLVEKTRGARRVALLAAIFGGLALPSTAQNFVRPGDTGRIILAVPNSQASAGPMTGVIVTPNAPSGITIQSGSVLGPLSIDPGSSGQFIINYTIASDATGTITLPLHVAADASAVPRSYDTSVSFTIATAPTLESMTSEFGPIINPGPQNYTYLYNMFTGAASASNIPATPVSFSPANPTLIDFWVSSPVGVASITVTGPQGPVTVGIDGLEDGVTLSSANVGIPVHASFTVLTPGLYTTVYKDILGNQTVAPFNAGAIAANIDFANATRAIFNTSNYQFDWTFGMNIAASLGVSNVSQIHADGTVANAASASGTSVSRTFNMADPFVDGVNRLDLNVTDKGGNSMKYMVYVSCGYYDGFVPPPWASSLSTAGYTSPLNWSIGSVDFASVPDPEATMSGVSIQTLPTGATVLALIDPFGEGTYTTRNYDVLQATGMPGAVMLVNSFLDAFGVCSAPVANPPILQSYDSVYGGSTSGPLPIVTISQSALLHAKLQMITDPGGNSTTSTLYDGPVAGIVRNGDGGSTSGCGNVPSAVTVGRHVQLTFSLKSLVHSGSIDPAFCDYVDPDDSSMCLIPQVVYPPAIISFGQTLRGLFTNIASGYTVGTDFDVGPNQGADIASGVSISNMNVTSPGTMSATLISAVSDTGYVAALSNASIVIQKNGGLATSGPFTVSIDGSQSDLTPAQLQNVRVVANNGGVLSQSYPVSVDSSSQIVSVSVNPADNAPIVLQALVPAQQHPAVVQNGSFTLTYDNQLNPGQVSLQTADPSTGALAGLLAQALARGLTPLGPVEQLTFGASALSGTASLQAPYTAQPSGASPPALYMLAPGAPPQALSGQFSRYAQPLVSGNVGTLNAYYGVFAATTPVLLPDTTPPVTTLSIVGVSSASAGGVVTVSTSTRFLLTATDPGVLYAQTSGVSQIYYVIDSAPFTPPCNFIALDTSAANGTCANEAYGGPFTLSPGTHTVYYFAEDKAGNQETVNVASFTVTPAPSDVMPPRTAISASTPSAMGAMLFAGVDAQFLLGAVDDAFAAGDGLGNGPVQTFLSVDSAPFAAYAGPFTLAEGEHFLRYYSVDASSNAEVIRSTAVAVDVTPPVTTLQVLGSSSTDASGVIQISSAVLISLSTADPVSNGVASGVNATYAIFDVDPFSTACANVPLDSAAPNGTCANATYDGPFTLSPGTHTVYFLSEDLAGNQEFLNVASFTVTAATPSVYAAASPVTVGGRPELVFTATQAVTAAQVSTTAPAAVALLASAASARLTPVSSVYELGPEGATFNPPATVTFQYSPSAFAALNLSTSQVALYEYFATGGWQSVPGQVLDPVAQTVTAPISTLNSTFALFGSVSLALTPADGANLNVATPTLAAFYSGLDTATVQVVFRGGDVTSQSVVTAASATYVQTSALGEGAYVFSVRGEDGFGNLYASTSTFLIDVTPPATSLLIDSQPVSGTSFTITTADAIAFSTSDVGSGVAQIYYTVDVDPTLPVCEDVLYSSSAPSGTCANEAYAGSFGLSVGTHTVYFFSDDNAGNREAVNASSFSVAPALVSLSIAPSNASLALGATLQFQAVGTFSDGSTQAVAAAWSADSSSVATLSGSGPTASVLATGIGAGTVTVMASSAAASGTVSSTATLVVIAPSVTLTGLTIAPATATITSGDVQKFTAVGYFSDESTRTLGMDLGSWALGPDMPVAPTYAAVASVGGRFYVFGGIYRTSQVYDPATGNWRALSPPPLIRYYAQAAAVGSIIYVFGGEDVYTSLPLSENWAYDTVADRWTRKTPMPLARHATAGGVIDGKIYAAGGIAAGSNNSWVPSDSLMVYDPAVDIWTTKSPMPMPRAFGGAGAIGGKLYYAGGANNSGAQSDVMAYDPQIDSWTMRSPLPRPISSQCVAALAGKLYLVPGYPATYVYDPYADVWSLGTSLNFGRSSPVMAASETSLFTGGYSAQGRISFELSSVTPSVQWTTDAAAIATVTSWGLATGKGLGTAQVVASSGALHVSAALTVTAPAKLASIAISPSSTWLISGTTVQLQAVGTFTDGSTQAVAADWSVDATSVAEVSSLGLAAGLSAGAARVFASSGLASGWTILTVVSSTAIASSPWPTQRHDPARTALAVGAGPALPFISTVVASVVNIVGEPSIGPDGTLYFASTSSGLVALDPNLGVKWTFPTGGIIQGSAVRADGVIYVGGDNLWAVKPDGTLLWEVAASLVGAGSGPFTTPVIAPDGSLWTTKPDVPRLLKLNPATGGILAETAPSADLVAPLTMGPDGTLYLGRNNVVQALHQNGSAWNARLPQQSYFQTMLLHSNGALFVAAFVDSLHGLIQAINPNGTLGWASSSYGSFRAMAEGPDGTLYAVNDTGVLYALNPDNGALKWSLSNEYFGGAMKANYPYYTSSSAGWFHDYSGYIHDPYRGIGLTVDSSGTVFVTGTSYEQNTLGLFSISSAGTSNWFLPLSGSVGANSPILDANGNLYIGGAFSSGGVVKIEPGFAAASTATINGRPELTVTSANSALTATIVPPGDSATALALAKADAAGLQLLSDVFDLSPSISLIPPANIAFRFDPAVVGDTTTLAIYRFDGVSWSSAGAISNQLVMIGADPQLTAALSHSSYYGLFRSRDILPPRTALNMGPVAVSSTSITAVTVLTVLTLTAADDRSTVRDGLGVGVAQIYYVIDADPFSPDCAAVPLDPGAPNGTCANEAYGGPFALSPGTHTVYYFSEDLAGNQEVVNVASFSVAAPPVLALSPADGSVVAFSTPTLTALYSGAGSVDPASVRLSLNGIDVTTQAVVTALSATYVSTGLLNGGYVFAASASDFLGVSASTSAAFVVDAPLPVTSLFVDSRPVAGGPLTITSTDTLSLTAADLAGAVAATFYVIDADPFASPCAGTQFDASALNGTCANEAYSGPFTLVPGTHTVYYFSEDAVGNQETVNVISLVVVPVQDASSGVFSLVSIAPPSAYAGMSLTGYVAGTGFDASASASLEKPFAAGGTWTSGPAMNVIRAAHQSVVLRDGRVLAAGGEAWGAILDSAELYDPASGAWSAATPMPTARYEMALVLLQDGRVLAAGGRMSFGGDQTTKAEVYDPAANAWTATPSMPTAFDSAVSVLLPDGRVLIAGGYNGSLLASSQLFDPVSGTWSVGPSMAASHANGAATLLKNGKVLVAGGVGAGAAAELFDPASNSWTAAGSMAEARYLQGQALLPDGRVIVAGGWGTSSLLASSEIYDPATNAWTPGPDLNAARSVWSRPLVVDGQVMLADGVAGGGSNVTSVEVYDPAANVWRLGAPLQTPHSYAAPVQLNDGRILMAGGYDAGWTPQNSVELLTPPTIVLTAARTSLTDSRHLSVGLNLAGATTGYWDVVVRQSGGRAARLSGAFGVKASALSLTLTPADGVVIASSYPIMTAAYVDDVAVAGGTVRLSFDGADVTGLSVVGTSSAVYIPSAAVAEGTHTFTASAADVLGSPAVAAATFLVDTTPPSTSLLIDSAAVAGGSFIVASTDTIGFSASDAGSGVLETVYLLDQDPNACDFTSVVNTAPAGTCANPYFSSAFSLSPGTHTVAYYSDDVAGNSENYRYVAIRVQPPQPGLALVPADGSTVAFSTPTLTVAYLHFDVGGVDPSSVRLSLNGIDVTAQAVVTALSATYVSTGLLNGSYVFAASASDFYGAAASTSVTFAVGAPLPVTTLSIGRNTAFGGSFTIASTDTLSLMVSNLAGASTTYYVIDAEPFSPSCAGTPYDASALNGTCANEAYNGPFTLSPGTHTVYYFSEDAVGNQETVNAVSFTVLPAVGSTYLSLASISPASAYAGSAPTARVAGTGFDSSASASLERPFAAGGTWTSGSAMNVARALHQSVLLRDGRVLAAGGQDAGGAVLDSVELYDPASGVWSVAAPMPTARYEMALVLLQDGRVLAAGGRMSLGGDQTAKAEVYDPAANAWAATPPMPTSFDSAVTALLSDGRVLIAGGYNGNLLTSTQLFDPISGAWSAGPDMAASHANGAATLLKSGKVLVAGGVGAGAAAELFDPRSNSWTTAGTMASARYLQGQALLTDGRVIAAGGWGATSLLASSEIYDPATNAWTPGPDLNAARSVWTRPLVVDGQVMLADGVAGGGSNVTSVEVYDHAANVWRLGAPLQTPHSYAAPVQLNDGRILMAGGYDASWTPQPSSELLAPPTTVLTAARTSLTDSRHLSVGLNLAGAATGYWDVVVRQSGGRAARLSGAFDVKASALSLAVTPAGGAIVASSFPIMTAAYVDDVAVPAGGVKLSFDGVDVTGLSAVGTSSAVYVPAAAVSEGTHTFTASAVDVLGVPAAAAAAFLVDTIPPVTTPTIDSSPAAGASFVVASTDTIGLSASDVGSGVAQIYYAVDADPSSPDCASVPLDPNAPNGTCANEAYAGPFNLPVGAHAVYFFSEDNAGNLETVASASFTVLSIAASAASVDGRPELVFAAAQAVTAILAPSSSAVNGVVLAEAGGLTFVSAVYDLGPEGTTFNPPAMLTFAYSAAALSALGMAQDGLGLYEYFPSGGWQLVPGQTVDPVTQTVTAPISVLNSRFALMGRSVAPPTTILTIGSPSYSSGTLYASASTPLWLTATASTGATVAATYLSIDSSTYIVDSGTFAITAEGLHSLSFFSVDALGRSERASSSVLSVDATPPVTTLQAPGSSATDAAGYVDVSWGTRFSLSAVDPVSGGVASGVSQTYYTIDVDPSSPDCANALSDLGAPKGTCANEAYVGPFSLSPGTHTVYYFSDDDVDNLEAVNAVAFLAAPPPLTALTIVPSSATLSVGRAPVQFQAIGTFADGSMGTVAAAWSVDAASVATITSAGLATGLASGAANAIASSGTLTARAPLAVRFADGWPPVTTVAFSTPVYVSGGGMVAVSTAGTVALSAADAAPQGVTPSGVAATYYSVDSASPTSVYAGPFHLAAGAHAVYYYSTDNAGNAEAVSSAAATAYSGPYAEAISRSSGPVGVVVSLTGFNFGPYRGSSTQLLFGASTSAISVWNASSITAVVPFLPAGTYPLSVAAGGLPVAVGSFTVLTPQIVSVVPSSGPIGLSFTLTGTAFGTYNGANTQVLLGGTTCPVSVWNDSTITAVVPGVLAPGSYSVQAERLVPGGAVFSNEVAFSVAALNLASVSPSTGPIGVPFAINGSGFGTYNGSATQVLIGGTTAAISVWNDAQIQGVVPPLAAGAYPLAVERVQGAGVAFSQTTTFTVTALSFAGPSPSSGPIGISFTLTGSGFGPYAGATTRLLMGGTTVAVSVWTDATIAGVVPAVSTGVQPVWIERLSGLGVQSSATSYFTVVAPAAATISPSTGPIGIPFVINGSGFGTYNGANTQVLFAGTTASISVWNDASIQGVVPALSTGAYPVAVERVLGGAAQFGSAGTFTVTPLNFTGPSPSSGPSGTSFTLYGPGFGPYAGAATQVLIAGATAAVSVWNDATITATAPTLPPGPQPVWIARFSGAGVQTGATAYFTVTAPAIASVSPSSAPIGALFTLSGSGFGAYNGANTQVLLGGATCPVSVWNETTIKATVPGVLAASTGPASLVVERIAAGGISLSTAAAFFVTAPSPTMVTPSSAPIGAPFTISGSGFGAYNGAGTVVTFNGASAPVSIWNDTTITGTVPGAASSGPATVRVSRLVGSYASSAALSFAVLVPSITSVSPLYGPPGTAVTLTGYGFGPYAGASGTQLLVGGSTTTVSVWNDQKIVWTVPSSLGGGAYPAVVSRTPAGGSVQSVPVSFTVGTSLSASFLGARPVPLAQRPDAFFFGDLLLPAAEGGLVRTPSQAAADVPPAALSADTEITLARDKSDFAQDRAEALARGALSAAGEPIAFGPEGTQFGAPVVITLPYDPALVPEAALSALAVQFYDPIAKAWIPLVSQVDPVEHVVSARTSHFSLYQPLIPAVTVASGALDVFGLRAHYVFPNPVRGVRRCTIRIQPGLADAVTVRVYDGAGRRVLDAPVPYGGVVDDLNGLGPQDTYDFVWDVSGVGSGVYTYVITAAKAGQSDIRVSGKIGVVK